MAVEGATILAGDTLIGWERRGEVDVHERDACAGDEGGGRHFDRSDTHLSPEREQLADEILDRHEGRGWVRVHHHQRCLAPGAAIARSVDSHG